MNEECASRAGKSRVKGVANRLDAATIIAGMNHLAHLFLAGDSDESLLGNLAGDFVKGALDGRFAPGVRQGIAEHRRIDAFTDSHPDAGAIRKIIAVEQGHYARVTTDIFLDHLLSCEWATYSIEELHTFVRRTFARLDPHADAMPGRLRVVYPLMRDHGWLVSYSSIDAVWRTLYHLSRRFARGPRLEMSTHLLIDARPALLHHFGRFMPDVIAFASGLRR